jgi:hypothetical protein
MGFGVAARTSASVTSFITFTVDTLTSIAAGDYLINHPCFTPFIIIRPVPAVVGQRSGFG